MIILYLLLFGFAASEYHFETKWFTVPLDHFSYSRNETFKMKYLVNNSFASDDSGPIFFYTGNEGSIESFAQHTGFMWEIAREFNARLVFAEHRYYGASMPFGNESLYNENIGFLTTSQALADYAKLINFLQGGKLKPTSPVILFGGSYGGMLAAYFRIKYPHLAAGAIAASAPVHQFIGMVPCDNFEISVTSSFNASSATCVSNIKSSWQTIRNFFQMANSSDWLQKHWNLCKPVKNATYLQVLIHYLKNMYLLIATVNYPFASEVLIPLPANPVQTACQYLSEPLSGEKLLEGVGKIIDMFANYDRKNKCVAYISNIVDNLDAAAWTYQECTELVTPICSTGINDMFEAQPWDFKNFSDECHEIFNVYPRPDVAMIEYGGVRLHAASNIVFSNGLLDPWAGSGILESLSDSLVAVPIKDAAHHLDLMASNPNDPQSVILARDIHKKNIRKWIRQFEEEKKSYYIYLDKTDKR